MTVARILLFLTGMWFAWFGISALLDLSRTDLASVAIWFTGAILIHDALFAPLCAALGLTARHLLAPGWWSVAACGAICSVALTLIALPVLNRGNAMPTNPTVLDRNYPLGLTAALILIWTLVLLAHIAARRRTRPRSPTARAATPSD